MGITPELLAESEAVIKVMRKLNCDKEMNREAYDQHMRKAFMR